MAKKSAAAEFNMSEAIREILTANPNLSSKEVAEAVMAKYPTAKINKNSFSVAFYTTRKKLGAGKSKRRGRRFARKAARVGAGRTAPPSTGRPTVDIAMLQTTARFLSQVGGAEAALEAIKFVQAAQVN